MHRRDAELKVVQEERDDAKTKVAALLDELLRKPTTSNGTSAGSSATASSLVDIKQGKDYFRVHGPLRIMD